MRYKRAYATPRRAQRGLSLIEALITILVLSLGLIGLAGMQLSLQRSAHETMQRTQALTKAHMMVERIRANSQSGGSYATATAVGGGVRGANRPACAAPCTGAARANVDLWEWERHLMGDTAVTRSTALINARGCVRTQALNDNVGWSVDVAVWWLPLGLPNNQATNPNDVNCNTLNAPNPWQRVQLSTVIVNRERLVQ